MQLICLIVILLLWSGLAVPAEAATGAAARDAQRAPVVCTPSADGEGWACTSERGQALPQRTPAARVAERVAGQETLDGAAEPAIENLDPLTGISSDPADWYVEPAPRGVAGQLSILLQ